MMMTMMMNMEW